MPALKKSKIIEGKFHKDERGILCYFNEFDLTPIKRFYKIESSNGQIIRAWRGHKREQKWFHVISGSFKIVLVQPDDWITPSDDLSYTEFNLNEGDRSVLHIPGGYASGIQATKPSSQLLIFSDFSVEESLNDNFEFDASKWYVWI